MDTSAILSYLDARFESIEMPCLSNMNIDYVSTRMSAYTAPDSSWVLVFNSIVWWPSGDGLVTMIETVGPGVIGRQGFDNDRYLVSGRIETDDSGVAVTSVEVRGAAVGLESLDVQPDLDLQPEVGFWVATALLPDYRESLLGSEEEVRSFVPSHLTKSFQTDSWDHPDFGRPPSATETFPKLAAALASGDFSELGQCSAPNVHWSNWLPK